MVLWKKLGEGAVITVLFIKLWEKKISTYYVPDPVLHGWGKGAQKGVRPHYCAQVAPSLMERQIPTRLVKTKQNRTK